MALHERFVHDHDTRRCSRLPTRCDPVCRHVKARKGDGVASPWRQYFAQEEWRHLPHGGILLPDVMVSTLELHVSPHYLDNFIWQSHVMRIEDVSGAGHRDLSTDAVGCLGAQDNCICAGMPVVAKGPVPGIAEQMHQTGAFPSRMWH